MLKLIICLHRNPTILDNIRTPILLTICVRRYPQCLCGAQHIFWDWFVPYFYLDVSNVTAPSIVSPSPAPCYMYVETYKNCAQLQAYRSHATPWADVSYSRETKTKLLPRRTSAYTTDRNFLSFWWPGFDTIYWITRKFCLRANVTCFVGLFASKIRRKHSIIKCDLN